MGYYSDYVLRIEPEDKTTFLLEALKCITDNIDWLSYKSPIDSEYIYIEESIKWYEHEEDLIKISSLIDLKDCLITCSIKGEDGEESKVYARNGKVDIVYPEIIWRAPSEELMRS
ncbi:hypothetical protein H6G33_10050 [Calothrix sp. FACHB-1219]|uniref:hypothetical protein n=1 Tax=unclassified Calothrix TaxID=2619626 RepID=UPI00168984BB|nr:MULTISPECIES: hypothetical protein [unclassified Calothrix]MBD2201689.1 hypothetical protein [Calothrix sp. FACHB-168]MBD2217375.1 hypothetical protein [Calothrix sp. FACHB-1219]